MKIPINIFPGLLGEENRGRKGEEEVNNIVYRTIFKSYIKINEVIIIMFFFYCGVRSTLHAFWSTETNMAIIQSRIIFVPIPHNIYIYIYWTDLESPHIHISQRDVSFPAPNHSSSVTLLVIVRSASPTVLYFNPSLFFVTRCKPILSYPTLSDLI